MSIIQNLWSAIQAPWMRRWQSGKNIDLIDQSIGNGYDFTWRDAADANDLVAIGWDVDNAFREAGAVVNPTRQPLVFHVYPNANLVSQTFFVNPTQHALQITLATEVHTTAGNASGAVTAQITHETLVGTSQQAAGTGKAVLTTAFDEKGVAAETVQSGALAANYRRESRNNSVALATPGAGLITLQPGDSLSCKFAGTLTTLVGVTITVNVQPGSKYEFVSFYAGPAGIAVTTSLMTAMRRRTLLFGAAVWQTAEVTAATLTLDVTKDASGTAPGAGTSMLSATVNLKSAALKYTQLALSATAATLQMISTDSVAAKISAATTEFAGLCVTLAFDGKQGEVSLNYNSFNSTVGTDEEFFTADRDYEVGDAAAKWTATGTSNFFGLTSQTGTQTPSTGTSLQTDNTNKGFDTTGTINIPQFATLPALNKRFLMKGDRLGFHNQGTTGALAGLQASVRLIAR
jgi:hypothetical protein